ncbi:uncharacterized protein LOC111028347 [Myzus persicae]|uniref:uncharacterized protein LOC111028347 n=1 Tax=Myzus persicae TaxID=13164 RepID=UPI000B9384C1|nr:uncharacterized protein LOC111028347 [Myzus persicae]
MAPQLLAASTRLDNLLAGFEIEDSAVFDAYCGLNMLSEYTTDLNVEVNGWVDYIRSIVSRYHVQPVSPTAPAAGGDPHVAQTRVFRRLPEIPLPQFDGDIHKWPAFRDQFLAVVSQFPDIPDIERFYHLRSCIHGSAADIIRGILVSGATFAVAWAALVSRYDKPRLVAGSFVDQLLQVPVSSVDSLSDLNKFMSVFGEGISVLTALQVLDLGDFILFSLASRCLSSSCRTLFESETTSDFPTVEDLFKFIKNRIAILERVQVVAGKQAVLASRPKDRPSAPSKWSRKVDRPSPTSLVSAVPVPAQPPRTLSCQYCNNSHALDVCRKFSSLPADERTKWARAQRICFSCLSPDHWSPVCKAPAKCAVCSRRHHSLLHPTTKDAAPSSDAESAPIPTSLLSGLGSPSVVLCTALVHIRDRSGSFQVARALIDSASQINAISLPCAKRLGLRWSTWSAPISGLAGVPVVTVQGRVDCHVVPRYASDPVLAFESWVLPSITGDLPRHSLESSVRDKFSHLALADPDFHIAAPVDLSSQ